MSFTTSAQDIARKPVVYVELDLDFCDNTYGTAPCTASGAAGSECYNTYATCQDRTNYAASAKTYRFATMTQVPQASRAVPCVTGVSFAPAKIEPGGIGVRASVTVSLMDFVDTDQVFTDPYIADRLVAATGTFFGKLFSRNKHIVGRTMRVREGFHQNLSVFSTTSLRDRVYIIDSIQGPDSEGVVRITGKDVLKLADDNRATAPAPSTTYLNGAITNSGTTVVLNDGSGYVLGDKIAVESEIITLGTKSTHTFTGCTRGAEGTTAEAHEDGSKVQKCLIYTNENVRDVIEDLLVTYAGVPSAYIPTADWDDEKAGSLASFDVTRIIPKPIAVKDLLEELCDQCQASLWFDDLAQELRLKGESQFDTIAGMVTEDTELREEGVDTTLETKRQITRVTYYYAPRTPFAEQKPEQYKRVHVEIDADAESTNAYAAQRAKVVYSKWFLSTDQVTVELAAGRMLDRYSTIPLAVTFELDAAHTDAYQMGDVLDIRTSAVQNYDGTDGTLRAQILKITPREAGHSYKYEALTYFPESTTVANQTISSNTTNYNLFAALGGPPGPIEVTVTINAGVVVSSNNPSLAAFSTVGLHPDSVITVVLGAGAKILGRGGDGGTFISGGTGIGQDGTHGIELGCPIILNNGGTIRGGGGGGGATDATQVFSKLLGGGGGAGSSVGTGGAGTGGAGANGTETAGGAGQVDGAYSGAAGGSPGVAGSYGFVWGSFGGIFTPYALVAGGAKGYAIKTHGYTVTYAATGTIVGDVG